MRLLPPSLQDSGLRLRSRSTTRLYLAPGHAPMSGRSTAQKVGEIQVQDQAGGAGEMFPPPPREEDDGDSRARWEGALTLSGPPPHGAFDSRLFSLSIFGSIPRLRGSQTEAKAPHVPRVKERNLRMGLTWSYRETELNSFGAFLNQGRSSGDRINVDKPAHRVYW